MNKLQQWDNLTRHEDKFAQCPVSILNSNISDKALRLYLVLWWKAFCNRKYNKYGQQCVYMSYEEICKAIHCSKKTAIETVNELKANNLVSVERTRKNRFTFTRKEDWFTCQK